MSPAARAASPERTVFQQAHLVTDLAEAAERWRVTIGAGPFFLAPHHRCDRFTYRGEPVEADVSYAFGYADDLQIQLVQQHDDTPSIYREMFAAGEEGLHHVGVLVEDFDAERARLLGEGFEPACELEADGAHAAYFDTREAIGCFTELHNTPERIMATFATWRAAHDGWDGVTRPLRERGDVGT